MKLYRIGPDNEHRLHFPADSDPGYFVHFEDAEAAIKAAVEAERENICDWLVENDYVSLDSGIIRAIRTRGEE